MEINGGLFFSSSSGTIRHLEEYEQRGGKVMVWKKALFGKKNARYTFFKYFSCGYLGQETSKMGHFTIET